MSKNNNISKHIKANGGYFYYSWRKRQGKEVKDQWLVDLIVECQEHSKQTYGSRPPQGPGGSIHIPSILRPDSRIPCFSVHVQPGLSLRQCCDGKLLRHLENRMLVPRSLFLASRSGAARF